MTHSLIDGIAARLTGPMNLRFIMQPLAAILLGIKDGRADARAGEPPFVIDVFSDSQNRKSDLLGALRRLLVPITIGTILDAIFQYLVFRDEPGRRMIVHPGSALLVGTTVMGLPYTLARGLTNRILSGRARRRGGGSTPS